jgi:hypothetical protein
MTSLIVNLMHNSSYDWSSGFEVLNVWLRRFVSLAFDLLYVDRAFCCISGILNGLSTPYLSRHVRFAYALFM